jgi:mRNA-degrading endonuclease RelE of RelBE toxin-antitoxin system
MVTMARQQPFTIVFDPAVKRHLRRIEPKYHSLIRATVRQQVLHEPAVETRNRKPLLRPMPFGGEWELRFGPNNRFRVFYTVNVERRLVHVFAVGVKEGNRLFIGGEEFP